MVAHSDDREKHGLSRSRVASSLQINQLLSGNCHHFALAETQPYVVRPHEAAAITLVRRAVVTLADLTPTPPKVNPVARSYFFSSDPHAPQRLSLVTTSRTVASSL
jgi:hypothetical protein